MMHVLNHNLIAACVFAHVHFLHFFRSGRYILNTSSDGEHLLESPGQSPQQLSSNVSRFLCMFLPLFCLGHICVPGLQCLFPCLVYTLSKLRQVGVSFFGMEYHTHYMAVVNNGCCFVFI